MALPVRKLPLGMFQLPRLLAEGGLQPGYPAAHVPHGVTSIPKPFQLQVRGGPGSLGVRSVLMGEGKDSWPGMEGWSAHCGM